VDDLTLLPWEALKNVGAIGLLCLAVLMVMRGTLATPKHQKVLTDENQYLRGVVKDQQETIQLQAKNTQAIEEIGKVVGMTMNAIRDRYQQHERDKVGGPGDAS